MDLNGHMGNTAYCAYATNVRFMMFQEHGFNFDPMGIQPISPIVFREELTYQREVKLGEEILVTCEVLKLSKDFKKFSFIQKIIKPEDILAAVIIFEGAWFNLRIRKAVLPPYSLVEICKKLPRSDQFKWID